MIHLSFDLHNLPIITAIGLFVSAGSPAMAQLGQSQWQTPANSAAHNQQRQPQQQTRMSGDGFASGSQLGQSQWLQPETSSSGLGKSEWINPGGNSGQPAGQSQWMQSDNGNTGLGKSQWINPGSSANSDMSQGQWQQDAAASNSPKLIGAVLQEEQKINEPGTGLAPGFTSVQQNMAPAGNALNEPVETTAVQSQQAAPQPSAVGTGAALGSLLGANGGNQAASMLQMAQTVPLAMQMLMNAMPHGPMGGGFGAPGMGMAPGIGGGYGTGSNIANRVVRRTTNQAANRLNQSLNQMINRIGR